MVKSDFFLSLIILSTLSFYNTRYRARQGERKEPKKQNKLQEQNTWEENDKVLGDSEEKKEKT